MNRTIARFALVVIATGLASPFLAPEAAARQLSVSAGGGVKCSYILVSSVNGVNTYQTVCRKSGV